MSNLSARERKKRRFSITLGVAASAVVILLSVLFYIDSILQRETKQVYSVEELMHDHDGDGIPDHGADAH